MDREDSIGLVSKEVSSSSRIKEYLLDRRRLKWMMMTFTLDKFIFSYE